jgi:hypothetical protein
MKRAIVFDEKNKVIEFKQLRKLTRLLKVESVYKYDDLRKYLKDHDEVVVYLDPYQQDINDMRVLNWAANMEQATEDYNESCDSI